ncbi:MAG TPA: hypothetical protein VKQ36_09475 [Ktedonobacterales bacterium]|nr:hypothetical protein [Ktedonobacterales bacterium]
MPYKRIERDDGSSYTVWEAAPANGSNVRNASTTPPAYTFADDNEGEAPTPPEPESIIRDRIRLQSGGVNGCTTFGCLLALMLLVIAICGALYFLPYL